MVFFRLHPLHPDVLAIYFNQDAGIRLSGANGRPVHLLGESGAVVHRIRKMTLPIRSLPSRETVARDEAERDRLIAFLSGDLLVPASLTLLDTGWCSLSLSTPLLHWVFLVTHTVMATFKAERAPGHPPAVTLLCDLSLHGEYLQNEAGFSYSFSPLSEELYGRRVRAYPGVPFILHVARKEFRSLAALEAWLHTRDPERSGLSTHMRDQLLRFMGGQRTWLPRKSAFVGLLSDIAEQTPHVSWLLARFVKDEGHGYG